MVVHATPENKLPFFSAAIYIYGQMKLNMTKWSDLIRVRFYLALFYFIWSLLPHFHVVTHSHAGGNGFHSHARFSAAEIAFANNTLDALGPAALASGGLKGADNAEWMLEEKGSLFHSETPELPRPGSEVTALNRGLKSTNANAFSHNHYFEDANLLGVLSVIILGLALSIFIPYSLRRIVNPFSIPFGFAFARGPPVYIPA